MRYAFYVIGALIGATMLAGVARCVGNERVRYWQISTANGVYTGIWMMCGDNYVTWQDPKTLRVYYSSAPYAVVEMPPVDGKP